MPTRLPASAGTTPAVNALLRPANLDHRRIRQDLAAAEDLLAESDSAVRYQALPLERQYGLEPLAVSWMD